MENNKKSLSAYLSELCPKVIPIKQGIYSCSVKIEDCAFNIHVKRFLSVGIL